MLCCWEEVYEPIEWIPALSWGHITHYNLTASNRAWQNRMATSYKLTLFLIILHWQCSSATTLLYLQWCTKLMDRNKSWFLLLEVGHGEKRYRSSPSITWVLDYNLTSPNTSRNQGLLHRPLWHGGPTLLKSYTPPRSFGVINWDLLHVWIIYERRNALWDLMSSLFCVYKRTVIN